jgi:hypothetical protein
VVGKLCCPQPLLPYQQDDDGEVPQCNKPALPEPADQSLDFGLEGQFADLASSV